MAREKGGGAEGDSVGLWSVGGHSAHGGSVRDLGMRETRVCRK